jgi:hypothetical protein
MHELVLDGEAFSVSIPLLITKCHLFEEDRTLLAQRKYDVCSRVSLVRSESLSLQSAAPNRTSWTTPHRIRSSFPMSSSLPDSQAQSLLGASPTGRKHEADCGIAF